ncbi:unannotated protein [freshwater metagenome]|uniref:Unannotated protein n=1 Tax=freshwater metagenome TaxID=449393 RepID=A0A6J7USN9_9ZZZZ
MTGSVRRPKFRANCPSGGAVGPYHQKYWLSTNRPPWLRQPKASKSGAPKRAFTMRVDCSICLISTSMPASPHTCWRYWACVRLFASGTVE